MDRRLCNNAPFDAFRILVVDEAHHATADSYRKILAHFRAHILGVTATPDRGDKQPLEDRGFKGTFCGSNRQGNTL